MLQMAQGVQKGLNAGSQWRTRLGSRPLNNLEHLLIHCNTLEELAC